MIGENTEKETLDDKPNVDNFLNDAVDTMYGDGQDDDTFNKLKGADVDEILKHFEDQGYTEDEIIDAMNDYFSDEEEVEDTEEPGAKIIETEEVSIDTDGDGEIDRTEKDIDGDGEVDEVHIEADSPKELKKALNDPHAASTPEEEKMYTHIFKKNAKDTGREFKPETPEEKEMEDMFKPSSGMLDVLKGSF